MHSIVTDTLKSRFWHILTEKSDVFVENDSLMVKILVVFIKTKV